MMEGLKHFSHNHPLILNEVESPVDKVVECVGCKQPINKLIDSFYSCTSLHTGTSTSTSTTSTDCLAFFMHRTCAELPENFIHPKFKFMQLTLGDIPCKIQEFLVCSVCGSLSQGLIYSFFSSWPVVCLKCVTSELKSLEDRDLIHLGHNHPLTLFQKPALVLCDACNTTSTDLSYTCTNCSFSMHKSCATAPANYKCKFHDKHPLVLAYSVPVEYQGFVMYCSICNKYMNPIYWLYYCANCRFFAHVKCASSDEMLSKNETDEAGLGESNLIQLPAADVSSLNEMMQQLIIEATPSDYSSKSGPPDQINHWAHEHHQLVLRNRNSVFTLDLDRKLSGEGSYICNGCIKPISSGNDIFYECNSCNYILHSSCALFPKEMQHPIAGKLIVQRAEPYENFICGGCGIIGNGIALVDQYETDFHIGCVSLPKIIKHGAHQHPLNQCTYPNDNLCKACHLETKETIMFGCAKCNFYIHIQCATKPRSVSHRWDPHLLSLILFSKDITDHPHEFQCEFCSKEINPNTWFYHCSDCDQSFHMHCIDKIYPYPNLKFGATNIESMDHPHPHGLTFILNKKKRMCNQCGIDTRGKPVLECSSCQFIVHVSCW